VKHWQETRQVLDRLAALRAAGRSAAIATVVAVRGSAYRREGAKLLVADDGHSVGNVSGGCLEREVREIGARVIRTGRSELQRFCSGQDEIGAWNMGLGCDGQVDVFVAPAGEASERQRALLGGDEPFALCTLVAEGVAPPSLLVTATDSEGALVSPLVDAAVVEHARSLVGGRSGIQEIGGHRVFVELFEPPPELVVIGAGADAPPIARFATEAGFRLAVVDWRPAPLDAARFPSGVKLVLASADEVAEKVALGTRSYVVMATHNFAVDEWYLRPLLRSPAPYIGILGPRARSDRLLAALEAEGFSDGERVHGPVGLDLGGEGAEQVALAIVAEILAVRAGRSGMPLRDRTRPAPIAAG
jgi:xanthine dehydrogenase accessory factor